MREFIKVWVENKHLFASPMHDQVVLLDTGSLNSYGQIAEVKHGGDDLVRRISEKVGVKIHGLAGMDWFGYRFTIDLRSHEIGMVIREMSEKRTANLNRPSTSFEINGRSLTCLVDTGAPYSFIRREFAPVRHAEFKACDFSDDGVGLSDFEFEGWSLNVRSGHIVKTIKVGVLPETRERALLNQSKSIEGIMGLEFIQGHVLSVNEAVVINHLDVSGNAQFRPVRPFIEAILPGETNTQSLEQSNSNYTMKFTGMTKEHRDSAIKLCELIRCHMLLLKWYQQIPVRHKIIYAPITNFERIYDLVSVILKVRLEDLEGLPHKYYQNEFDDDKISPVHLLELAHKIMGCITPSSLKVVSDDHMSIQLLDEIKLKMQTIEIAYVMRMI